MLPICVDTHGYSNRNLEHFLRKRGRQRYDVFKKKLKLVWKTRTKLPEGAQTNFSGLIDEREVRKSHVLVDTPCLQLASLLNVAFSVVSRLLASWLQKSTCTILKFTEILFMGLKKNADKIDIINFSFPAAFTLNSLFLFFKKNIHNEGLSCFAVMCGSSSPLYAKPPSSLISRNPA
jgi:hypothetical protein